MTGTTAGLLIRYLNVYNDKSIKPLSNEELRELREFLEEVVEVMRVIGNKEVMRVIGNNSVVMHLNTYIEEITRVLYAREQ